MAYSKKALRHMPTQTRKFARLVNELDSATKRLRNLINNSDISPKSTPTTAKQLRGTVKLGMAQLEDGKELFPGDVELAVQLTRKDAKHENLDSPPPH